MDMARQELLLFHLNNTEGLEESASQRADLLRRAWHERSGCDKMLLLNKLTAMQVLQHQLQTLAEKFFSETREAMGNEKKARHGILEYCRTGLGRKSGPRMFRKFS